MRVTQGMMSSNSLYTINKSYNRLSELYNQMDSGKKITKPSQDPVVAMKGINYRRDVNKVEQYERNLSEGFTWIDSADDALDKGTDVMQRMRELLVKAANDTNTSEERAAIANEIEQLKEQYKTIGNTKIGDKYIFNGSSTDKAPVPSPVVPYEPVGIQIADGVTIDISIDGTKIFSDDTLNKLDDIANKLRDPNTANSDINGMIETVDELSTNILASRTELGARSNRMDMIAERISSQDTLAKKIMSDNEDVDIEKVAIELKTQESIHRAALAVGARIIQPSLLDFLR